LSTHLREKEEKILKLLEELSLEASKGIPIIVEGAKDVQALRRLSIEGKIIPVKTGGKSFIDAVSQIENTNAHEVILLMDFDRRGQETTKKLVVWLEKAKIKPNLDFWRKLRGLVHRDLKDVEGLSSFMRTLRKKIGNS